MVQILERETCEFISSDTFILYMQNECYKYCADFDTSENLRFLSPKGLKTISTIWWILESKYESYKFHWMTESYSESWEKWMKWVSRFEFFSMFQGQVMSYQNISFLFLIASIDRRFEYKGNFV